MSPALLQVQNLTAVFRNAEGHEFTVLDSVNFELAAGEVLGIVGESGSGKSVTALSIMGLIASPGRVSNGRVLFQGTDLLTASLPELRRIRGADISMIFQEPMSSLNPVFSIGDQIMETLRYHQKLSRRQARLRAIELLQRVELPGAAQRIDEYPHQLSGGMRQRVMIAMALACNPKILIADEPTTALDVTIQAQILDLLRQLQRELEMAVIMITHDLGIIAQFADRVAVMYAGRMVEQAPVRSLFERPAHPYTEGLLASIPQLDDHAQRLQAIEGSVPSPDSLPPGCYFAPRCPYAKTPCREHKPELLPLISPVHQVACIRHTDYQPADAYPSGVLPS